jgi:predicted ester cyclase
VTSEQNKARALELVERVMNGHDLDALKDFTSNPAVRASAAGLVTAFPDLQATVKWSVAEADMVAFFFEIEGTHRGPWLFVREPTGHDVATAFVLAFRFDADGQIVDQWLGSNFVEILAQLGWGFGPAGDTAQLPG